MRMIPSGVYNNLKDGKVQLSSITSRNIMNAAKAGTVIDPDEINKGIEPISYNDVK